MFYCIFIYFIYRKEEMIALNSIISSYDKLYLQFYPFEGDLCDENIISISFFINL